MKRALLTFATLLAAGTPARGHRLDEYLQGTLISIEANRVDVQLSLTPGVAVFPFLIGEMDANADGTISEKEKRAYAGRVIHDLSLAIDGHPLKPHLISTEFPSTDEMNEGRGEIRIDFDAELPSGASLRKLTFDNRHQSKIAAYQVNALVSRDPAIQILKQNRNYSQSHYELEFTQAPIAQRDQAILPKALGILSLLLSARLVLVYRRKA